MKKTNIIAVLFCFLFSACDPAIGPVIVNKSSRDLIVEAHFLDKKMIRGKLPIKKIWWMGYKKSSLTQIRIFSDENNVFYELTEEDVSTLIKNKNEELILVIKNSKVDSIPRKLLPNILSEE